MKNELGVYVVPNPTHEHSGNSTSATAHSTIKLHVLDLYVGIILPQDIDPKLKEDFEQVLEQYATVKKSTAVAEMSSEQRQRTSERIGAFLATSKWRRRFVGL